MQQEDVKTIDEKGASDQPKGADSEAKASDKLSRTEKVCYGVGDLGNGFMFDLGQSYLTKFYTDVAMISPGVAGMIFAGTKIFDAFMDLTAGAFLDTRKARSKHGRFRPVMMVSAAILGLLTVLIFTMPDASMPVKIAWALATYMIWGVVFSFTNVPYGSLASVMTRDVHERAELASSRQTGLVAAQLVVGAVFVPMIMFFSGVLDHADSMSQHGYTLAAAVMAVFGVIGFGICFLGTRERIKTKGSTAEEEKHVKAYVKTIAANKNLGAMVALTLFTISAMTVNNVMMVYFCQYNLGNIGLQPIVNAIMMGFSVGGILLIPTLVKKFGKKPTCIGCFAIGAIADLLNFLLPTNPVTFIVFVTIGYVALSIPNGICWNFMADVIDYGHWHTGKRHDGITYAAYNFSRKLAQSLAGVLASFILALTGYVANQAQTDGTLLGIKGAMTLYPGVALVIAALILYFAYDITEQRYERISNDLNNGRWEHGKLDPHEPDMASGGAE